MSDHPGDEMLRQLNHLAAMGYEPSLQMSETDSYCSVRARGSYHDHVTGFDAATASDAVAKAHRHAVKTEEES